MILLPWIFPFLFFFSLHVPSFFPSPSLQDMQKYFFFGDGHSFFLFLPPFPSLLYFFYFQKKNDFFPTPPPPPPPFFPFLPPTPPPPSSRMVFRVHWLMEKVAHSSFPFLFPLFSMTSSFFFPFSYLPPSKDRNNKNENMNPLSSFFPLFPFPFPFYPLFSLYDHGGGGGKGLFCLFPPSPFFMFSFFRVIRDSMTTGDSVALFFLFFPLWTFFFPQMRQLWQ